MRRTYTVHQKSSSPHTCTSAESLNPQLVCCAEVNNSTFILTIVMMPPSVTQTDLPGTPGVADMITTFSTLLVPERTTSFTTSKVDIILDTVSRVVTEFIISSTADVVPTIDTISPTVTKPTFTASPVDDSSYLFNCCYSECTISFNCIWYIPRLLQLQICQPLYDSDTLS